MHTITCTIPGLGGTARDSAPRQETLATERMDRHWTFHAYRLSHDGKTTIVHRRDGFEVLRGGQRTMVRADLMHVNPREFLFHPDDQRFLMWCPFDPVERVRRVGLVELSRLSASPPWRVVYDPTTRHTTRGPLSDKEVVFPVPFGFEWSPRGEAFFVIEKLFFPHDPPREMETAIVRVELSGGKTTEVVRMVGAIDFFMPPVSRFEGGSGPSSQGYYLAFGHREGLFVIDPHGKKPARKISSLPATNLTNLEWNPRDGVDQLLLFFKQQVRDASGGTLSGVVLVHLDRVGPGAAPGLWQEQLYEELDVHTLWYSPRGTYATWGTRDFVAYRRPEGRKDELVQIVCRGDGGGLLEVKGMSWHASEEHLAITAGGRLFVHDVARRETREVARLAPDEARSFVAEPRWVGDQALLSRFDDVREEAKRAREEPAIGVQERKPTSPRPEGGAPR